MKWSAKPSVTVTSKISFNFNFRLFMKERNVIFKALHYKLFILKALSKLLPKLTIKTKRLLQLKLLSFVNVND